MPFKTGPLYPCNPATERAVSTKLSVDPKGEKVVYTNGRAVIIRDLNHTDLSHAYTQHTQSATVARISPSGFYCASGDVAGNVRIWDVTQPENILKLAIRPLGGRINDLAWDGESKRIIVGGDGKDSGPEANHYIPLLPFRGLRFGAAFFMDSGSTCGEITGHAKAITSLDIRHQRPFRAISGSDDNTVILHTGVPFKYEKMISQHARFVQDVRYSPDGEAFASVGSDGKIFIYGGKEGDVKGEIKRDSTSSLMACSWSKDSKSVASAGADGIVTIWDASTLKSTQTYTIGTDIPSQQNGVVYAGPNTLVSVSLSGVLNVFDTREGSKWRTLHGPPKAITSAVMSDKTFYTGSFDGSIKSFSSAGECDSVKGNGHNGRVAAMSHDGTKTWSAGWDDKVASIEGDNFGGSSIAVKAQPADIASTPGAVYVASAAGLEIHPRPDGSSSVRSGAVTSVAAHPGPNEDLVAFGNAQKKVSLGRRNGTDIQVDAEFDDNRGEVQALAFSPDGSLLAAADSSGRIVLIDTNDKKAIVTSRWTFHSGRVTSLNFSPNGKRLASGGMDESIYIWEVGRPLKNTAIKNSHPGGVSSVAWKDGNTGLISTGADGCVRTWTVDEI
ncbi:WD40-repeat-containing domain protein [Kockovaella imperatae]|uniref:WD40-repeat-containing domain protein n=1 Tax=Kockovaella imperatae TaxID=4999 RepID=A0A1Y1UER7_9TREE|nr:WD40-repeat-containing domain protein [Kockovaella imperatae]ORX36518.1 WD40-repeat-containing domain protein [Kockovaella imperatae]